MLTKFVTLPNHCHPILDRARSFQILIGNILLVKMMLYIIFLIHALKFTGEFLFITINNKLTENPL